MDTPNSTVVSPSSTRQPAISPTNFSHLDHPVIEDQNRRKISIWAFHILVPLAVFLLYFVTYNKFKMTTSEMIKTSGLWSITLLSITLMVGPLSKYIKLFNHLKVHRKFWGITSFFVALAHFGLVVYKYYHWDFVATLSLSNPKAAPVWAGMVAIILLFLITVTSNKKSVELMGAKRWKLLQTMSYLALAFVLIHFYLAETKDGVLVIKRFMGRFAMGFGILAILVRLWVFVHVEIAKRKEKSQPLAVPTVPGQVQ